MRTIERVVWPTRAPRRRPLRTRGMAAAVLAVAAVGTGSCTARARPVGGGAPAATAPERAGRAVVYTIRVPAPATQTAQVEARFPTDGREAVELMMPVWSPGYYRVQDYASRAEALSAETPDGAGLPLEKTRPNRWRVRTGGVSEIVVRYRLECSDRFVTLDWVSPDLGVLNGGATYITLADARTRSRPQEVRLEAPPGWPDVATGLAAAPDGRAGHFVARDYDELLDSPIVGGDLDIHVFRVQGVPHYLVDAGDYAGFDGERAASDLARVVEQSLPLWGKLPYRKYVFLNVFRRGGGGLEHASSTLLTSNAAGTATPAGYRRWLAFAAHEYFHALNVKRLRPVVLGPFDYEAPPRTPSLWFSEGVTSYYADLLLARAGLADTDWLLGQLSSQIASLQGSPGRLRQSVRRSSLEVWSNSNSGVAADSNTVSYYVKGEVIGFLLDARIRAASDGRRSLDDVVRRAYARYGGERGFTPRELSAIMGAVAGVELDPWLDRALDSTRELDYSEALDWFGLRFSPDGWEMEVRPDASAAQRARLAALVAPAQEAS